MTKKHVKRIMKEHLKLKNIKMKMSDKFIKKKKEMNIKNTLKLSYDLIGFSKKKKTRKKKTMMTDFFDNVKNNKKINMPNNDDDFDENYERKKQLFNKILKKPCFNTATSSGFINKW